MKIEYFFTGISWFWHLRAGNNRLIADGGESYATRQNVLRAARRFNNLLKEPLPIVEVLY